MYFENELDGYDVKDYWGKSFTINGPGELNLEVDYDDVPHSQVAVLARQMVAILNAHWVPIQARVCEDPEAADFDSDFDNDDCYYVVLPLDGPDRCPTCGGPLKVIDLG